MPRSSPNTRRRPPNAVHEKLLAEQDAVNASAPDESTLAAAAEASFPAIRGGLMIPIERIDTWDRQPRKEFVEKGIDDLASSIRETGLLEPLVVRRAPGRPGIYLIVAGHRRLLALRRLYGSEDAAIRADVSNIPCIVREASEDAAYADALIENLIRTDLTRRETLDALVSLSREFGWSGREIARRTSRSTSDVAALLSIASHSTLYQAAVDGVLSVTAAGILLPLRKDEETVMTILSRVRAGALEGTVDAMRQEVGAYHAAQMTAVTVRSESEQRTESAMSVNAAHNLSARDDDHANGHVDEDGVRYRTPLESITPIDSDQQGVRYRTPLEDTSAVAGSISTHQSPLGERTTTVATHERRLPDGHNMWVVDIERTATHLVSLLSSNDNPDPASLGKLAEIADVLAVYLNAHGRRQRRIQR